MDQSIFVAFFRSWDLEKQVKQLRIYRDLYQALNKWICDARRRQETIEAMKLGDVSTVMRYLQEQKVMFCHKYTKLIFRTIVK